MKKNINIYIYMYTHIIADMLRYEVIGGRNIFLAKITIKIIVCNNYDSVIIMLVKLRQNFPFT